MKRYILLIIINTAIALFQSSFMLEFFGVDLNPSLVLSLSFGFILVDEIDLAYFSSFIGGLVLDLLSTNYIGISPLLFVLFIMSIIYLKRYLFKGVHILLMITTPVLYKLLLNIGGIEYLPEIVVGGLFTFVISWVLQLLIYRVKKRYLSTEFRIRA